MWEADSCPGTEQDVHTPQGLVSTATPCCSSHLCLRALQKALGVGVA